MPEQLNTRWDAAAQNSKLQAALRCDDVQKRLSGAPLWDVANDSNVDDDVRYIAGLLATIAWFMPNGDDWTNPYGPFATFGERSSPIPSDFTETDLAALTDIADSVPALILQSRILDVLAITGDRSLRPKRHVAQLQALANNGVSSEAMTHASEQWDRGLAVGVRFRGVAASQLAKIESQLVKAATASLDGGLAVSAARLLSSHQLGRDHAEAIAAHLMTHAEGVGSTAAQQTLKLAAKWYRHAGNVTGAEDATYAIVQRLVSDASASEPFLAANHLEMALKTLRTLPRAARERIGVAHLPDELARQIRESGSAALGHMSVFTTESVDLSDHVADMLAQIRSDNPVESMRRFVEIQAYASLTDTRSAAERGEQQSPFRSVAARQILHSDGRTVYRSPSKSDSTIYGEKAPIWEGMINQYELRVSILGGVLLPKAWAQLTTDHRITILDFHTLVAGSSIVPSTHEGTFARGLHYGYCGDFGAAAHLLTPAIEALVRLHLAHAGERTSAISYEGIENEIGLSSLMENKRVVEIFGEDVAFEIRALMCGPIGPNLRNEVAHGLIGDSAFSARTSFYLWWLTLKLVLTPYWNPLHNAEATDARESSAPPERD